MRSRPRLGGDAGDLAEAVEALAEGGGQLVEPLRLDGVLHLVIVPAPPESALEDGHRERPAPGPDDGLEGLALALRDDPAREDLAIGLGLAELFGEGALQALQVEVAVRPGEDQDVVGPDAVRGAVGEEERDLVGGEDRSPPFGEVDGELELALDPAVGLRVDRVGAGVRGRDLGRVDQEVERGLAVG